MDGRPPRDTTLTRRQLLGAGLAAGTLLALGADATPGGTAPLLPVDAGPVTRTTTPRAAFEHIVVLMMENRSFDQVLGWLYPGTRPRRGQRFAGLADRRRTNPTSAGGLVAAHRFTGSRDQVLISPTANAGEGYANTVRQLWATGDADGEPTMDGFVTDYQAHLRGLLGRDPDPREYAQVMGGFPPDALPVLTTLAEQFGVFDHWFSAVPSDTWPNRAFFHAATSNGFTSNSGHGGYRKWRDAPAAPTVFNTMQQAGVPWRVYYDASQVVSLTGILAAPAVQQYWQSNFRSMEQFHADARSGDLPAYSFIEPRMVFSRNSMHPPSSAGAPRPGHYSKAVADMLAAEALVAEVYSAIRDGGRAGGSNPSNTTLLITFDEHGGMYDHVPPPRAVPPEEHAPAGEDGFRFDRLGVRVPTIVVSAYTDARTVVNTPTDHCSVIRTLNDVHGLPSLTDRDRAAAPITAAANRTTPRPVSSWPVVTAPVVPRPPVRLPRRSATTPAGRSDLLAVLLARFEPGTAAPSDPASAYEALVEHGHGLFGLRDDGLVS
ncbi:hypothetical protein Csp2054_15865 [Curtobacterium sp. 'Ferrero']|uniref:alkaline phosphatase family protein n=1 Tax=Curtobacterium sp. 'Ferrero' TaxID=2033654 RepID=UPI000BDCF523|nr:alkaline phosphatase family protein [Curtobacterium sp. 'Ferrero']PCN46706.1 hypothetical protein Csp2054_15865 [Curtobacterium sp. 'Ferrero']